MSEECVILDNVDYISARVDEHVNALNVLRSLHIGMFQLAQFTRAKELLMLEEPEGGFVKIRHQFRVNDETLFLGCAFDWFSISLVSYLRLVKLIELMESNHWEMSDLINKDVKDKIKKACPRYIRSVAPAVYKWRNKIAAHRAATDPTATENLTMITYSTMPAVSYSTPYYGVMNFKLFMGGGIRANLEEGTFRLTRPVEDQLDLEQWSLTRTFEDLAPRLWPEVKLSPLPSWATNLNHA